MYFTVGDPFWTFIWSILTILKFIIQYGTFGVKLGD